MDRKEWGSERGREGGGERERERAAVTAHFHPSI